MNKLVDWHNKIYGHWAKAEQINVETLFSKYPDIIIWKDLGPY